jgi:hypothetical protein
MSKRTPAPVSYEVQFLDLFTVGRTLHLDFGPNNPNNVDHEIRALVDGEYVAVRRRQRKGFVYEIIWRGYYYMLWGKGFLT